MNIQQEINQTDEGVLDRGLQIALSKYNEELRKYDNYNSRAKYPLFVISFMLSFLSFFLKDKNLNDYYITLMLCLSLCLPVIFICILYIKITKPYKMEKHSSPEPKNYYEKLNLAESKSEFDKFLIEIYTQDQDSYLKLNIKRGRWLMYMNIFLCIVIFLFIVNLLYFYDYDIFAKIIKFIESIL